MEDTVSEIQHDIDPKLKGYDWILKAVKIHWEDSKRYLPADCMFHGYDRYRELLQYAMGRNTIDKYKPKTLGEQQNDETWENVDWTVRSTLQIYFEKAVSKMLQRQFNINAIVIDPMAKSEKEAYYNQLMVKDMMRIEAAQQNPDLLNSPALKLKPGEPKDMEEIEMHMEYGYRNRRAMESEMIVDLVTRKNKIERERKKNIIYLLATGLGGYKEWMDETGDTKFRAAKTDRLVTSYCEEDDFSDANAIGEAIDVRFSELSKWFDKAQLDFIRKSIAGKWGNPMYGDSRWQSESRKFKAQIWDVEFQSYNTNKWESSVDKYGNLQVSKTSFNTNDVTQKENGSEIYRDSQEVWYKAKWIVGTEYMYEWGICKGMKRNPNKDWATESSYHLYAWNFDRMNFSGLVERLIPIQDEIQNTIMKMQNWKAKWIPYIIKIDLSSLERTSIGAKGKKMTPMQLLDFMFQNHVMVVREDGINGSNPNYKSLEVLPTQMAEEFKVLFDDLQRLQNEMEQKAGFNTVTAGGNVNPKLLTPGYETAEQGTADSLYLPIEAEKRLMERLSTAIVQRAQAAINMGKGDVYSAALGDDSIAFYEISPDLPLSEVGIFMEDIPTDADIQMLFQNMNMKESQGLLFPEDVIMIKSCKNLKQAERMLAYRVKKRREEQMQQEQQKIAMNGQQNTQTGIAVEKERQNTLQMQLDMDLKKIAAQAQVTFMQQQMKGESAENIASMQAQAKVMAQQLAKEAKYMEL